MIFPYMDEYEKKYGNKGTTMGHKWIRDTDGNLDVFAYEAGNCNGPKCESCGYEFCHHCHEMPKIECPKRKVK